MFVKVVKSFLLILFLVFAFIDAANIVDLFSNSEVIHFDEGNPGPDYGVSNIAFSSVKINSSQNSLSAANFGSQAKRKSSFPKLLIYDQDSPSVLYSVQIKEESIASSEPPDYTILLDKTISKTIYIENCRLQI